MIQFNLLPDVKLEYIKARRLKRTVILISSTVASASLVILIMLFMIVSVFQARHISNLSAEIKKDTTQLNSIDNLEKVLTIQNQLKSLPTLHDQKPVTSRLLKYLQSVTPKNVAIASVEVDFTAKTMKIQGSSDSISNVNTYVDTLKFTDFTAKQDTQTLDPKKAFPSVVLSNFGKDDKGASYELNITYDPLIFDGTYNVDLKVPAGKITTRSETEKPEPLFQPLSNNKVEQ